MPDIAAARPVSGASIESAWGGQLHDAIEGLQAGTVTVSISAAALGTANVTFPRAYATPPIVLCTYVSTSGTFFAFVNGNPTTTGCVIALTTKTGANTTDSRPVAWLAIGTPA